MRGWQFDGDYLVSPFGRRVHLKDVADWLASTNSGRQYIQTPKWRGWRIVQQYLVPPGRTIRTFAFSVQQLRSLEFHQTQEERVLRAVNEE